MHERVKTVTLEIADEAMAYGHVRCPRETIMQSVKEFVNVMFHTNGMESSRATLKRGHVGDQPMIAEHKPSYAVELTGKHERGSVYSEAQTDQVTHNLVSKQHRLADLIKPKLRVKPAMSRKR